MEERPAVQRSPWPSTVPRHASSFVGRRRERRQVAAALTANRLLVLTGPGGAGKTRLAAEVAASCSAAFPDGAWWLDLTPLRDARLVDQLLADELGVRPLPGRTLLESVLRRLAPDRALVVMDNCEHLPDAAAALAAALIAGCPQVTVLATSRAPLGVPGESDWQVPPLGLPAGHGVTPAVVQESDAGRLFAERARQARSAYAVDDTDAAAVARICRELDGLPLAIELAAARVRMLSVEQIAGSLDDRLRLLTSGPRAGAPRHQTLRASVDWSHDLLAEPERVLFRRLGVFAGTWSLEATAAVCGGHGIDESATLDLLGSLVDQSLVVMHDDGHTARYGLLETVRQYALERLVASGELAAVRDRHLDVFLELAERAAAALATPRNLEWLALLEPDAANFDVAMSHAVARTPGKALRLGVALTMRWNLRGRFAAGQDALERAVAAAGPDPLRPRALWSRGHLASYRGDYEVAVSSFQAALAGAESAGDAATLARALYSLTALGMAVDPRGSRAGFRRAIELARASGDDWTLMSALTTLAWSWLMTGDFDEAETVFGEAAAAVERTGLEGAAWTALGLGWCAMARSEHDLARERFEQTIRAAGVLGEPVTEGFAHVFLARLELRRGREDAALARLEASQAAILATGTFMVQPATAIELARARAATGDPEAARAPLEELIAGGIDHGWTLCEALLALADVLRAAQDPDGALARAEEALELSERLGAGGFSAGARELLARLALERGEPGHAAALAHEALQQYRADGAGERLAPALDLLALVAGALGSHRQAARLLGAAARARSDQGTVRAALDRPALAQLARSLRTALGDADFAAAQAEGATMSLEEAVAWMRRARGTRKRPATGWKSLTPTEARVAELVALGLTNPQIADRMFVARATVKTHLAHIFRKLAIRSRAELAALVAREELSQLPK